MPRPTFPNTTSQMAASTDNSIFNLPSPTLTDPDMILPYEDERESSTPSPPFDAVRRLERDISQSGFQHGSSQYFNYDHNYSHNTATTGSTSRDNIGVAVSVGKEKHSSASHARWYEHHDVAPPLSDIGEEEEEDEYRRGGSYRLSQDTIRGDDSHNSDPQWQGKGDSESCDDESCSGSDSTVGAISEMYKSWPQPGREHDSSRNHTRTTQTDARMDRGRESGPEYGSGYTERSSFDSERDRMSAVVEEEGSDDDIKTAERILENAKKRLTHMEDNLTRARSSMRMTPSPAPSAYSPTPTSQLFGAFTRSLSKGERRAQTSLAGALLRQRAWQEMNANQPSHSRRLSDVHISSSQNARHPPEMRRRLRSASALASTNASGFGASDASSRNGYYNPGFSNRTPGPLYNYAPSSPTPEDNASRSNSPSIQGGSSSDHAAEENTSQAPKMSSMEEFNAVYPASPPSRAHSQLQVRGLHDQMQDLKSKLSNLKIRTQEDSHRRRSLQSLRTPSPFTVGEQWYSGAAEYNDSSLKRGSIVVQNSWDAQTREVKTENSGASENTSGPTASSSALGRADYPQSVAARSSLKASSIVETEDEFEDALGPEDRAVLDEILNEPLDSPELVGQDLLQEFPAVPPIPEALRHEDRIDAFDYEHFYLHSVLGNFSRGTGRRGSCSSTDSADTTRPGSASELYVSPVGDRGHRRSSSGDSVSTSATFATATEGEYSSEDEICTGEVVDQALGLTGKPATSRSATDLPFRQMYLDGWNGSLQSRQLQTRHRAIINNNHAIMDSPTCPDLSPGSNSSTPRASPTHAALHGRHHSNGHNTSTPQATVTQSNLISALISHSSPSSTSAQLPLTTSLLSEEDTVLLQPLLQKLGQVCSDLLRVSSPSSSQGAQTLALDEKAMIRLRRRVETATRVLNGELDV